MLFQSRPSKQISLRPSSPHTRQDSLGINISCSSIMQGSAAMAVSQVDIGAHIEQDVDTLLVHIGCCIVQRDPGNIKHPLTCTRPTLRHCVKKKKKKENKKRLGFTSCLIPEVVQGQCLAGGGWLVEKENGCYVWQDKHLLCYVNILITGGALQTEVLSDQLSKTEISLLTEECHPLYLHTPWPVKENTSEQ